MKPTKSIKEIMSETPEESVCNIKRSLTSTTNAKKLIAVRVVRLEKDKPKGEDLAKFIQRKLGIDIKEVTQHVYELAHIVRAVQSGKVNVSEDQFWKLTTYNLVQLSAFITKEKFKAHLDEATEVVTKGVKVRDGLRAIRKVANGDKPGKVAILHDPKLMARIVKEIENGDAELLTSYSEIFGKLNSLVEKAFDLESEESKRKTA